MWYVVVILCLPAASGQTCTDPIPVYSDLQGFAALAPDPVDGRRWRPSCQSVALDYNRMKHIPQQAVCRRNADGR
jgi:hypothetical protein